MARNDLVPQTHTRQRSNQGVRTALDGGAQFQQARYDRFVVCMITHARNVLVLGRARYALPRLHIACGFEVRRQVLSPVFPRFFRSHADVRSANIKLCTTMLKRRRGRKHASTQEAFPGYGQLCIFATCTVVPGAGLFAALGTSTYRACTRWRSQRAPKWYPSMAGFMLISGCIEPNLPGNKRDLLRIRRRLELALRGRGSL